MHNFGLLALPQKSIRSIAVQYKEGPLIHPHHCTSEISEIQKILIESCGKGSVQNTLALRLLGLKGL